jgi:hypothetical protein
MSAQEEIEWRLNKISIEDAVAWKRAGFTPWDAYHWQCSSESPVFERFRGTDPDAPLIERQIEFAKVWLSAGIPADKAFRWSMCDFAPVDAAAWIKQGITNVDLAARYRDAGHRP